MSDKWSPFDPRWEEEAFQHQTAVSEELFNKNKILEEGYRLPDPDGSRSSAFRADAVLNNSFDEKILRKSLKDIYLNSHHKLTKSNHANTHFYKWHGTMKDVTILPNTGFAEISLPTIDFIPSNSRDKYKLSQYFRQWIPITDLAQHYDTFKWLCLLFIDNRIYSDYYIKVDDKETLVQFKYFNHWIEHDYSIYVYKFDTLYQCRTPISYYICDSQQWMIPTYFFDPGIDNHDHVMAVFNRFTEDRSDGKTDIDAIGHNVEFLPVHDGYVDMTKVSLVYKTMIEMEDDEWLWMTTFVPKFIHEFPILLPADVIYRPYRSNMIPVFTSYNGENVHALTDEKKMLFINADTSEKEWNDGWQFQIRPIVLTDAFDNPDQDPYYYVYEDMINLRDLTVKGADIIETFYNFMQFYTTDKEFLAYCDKLEDIMDQIHTADNDFLQKRLIDLDEVYEKRYNEFKSLMHTIREEKDKSERFHQQFAKHDDFWQFISPLIWMPRELADKYYVTSMLRAIGEQSIWEQKVPLPEEPELHYPITVRLDNYELYESVDGDFEDPEVYIDQYGYIILKQKAIPDYNEKEIAKQHFYQRDGNLYMSIPYQYDDEEEEENALTYTNSQFRFRRPVDAEDFLIFEYNGKNDAWYPVELEVEHHFPDVYLLSDPTGKPLQNRVFKAFFFYSDSLNVREETSDIIKATPSWDNDVIEFELDKQATYRDVFMEKFYWMGLRSIYQGILQTHHRWEMIEYIKDNIAYRRFNDLFLKTMDPYFQMGMTTYLNSDNFEFPFDDAVQKMNEVVKAKFLGYSKITNYEIYLNNSWVPSYFDYLTDIIDDAYAYDGKVIRRPRDSFDPDRILSLLQQIKQKIHNLVDDLSAVLDWIIQQINDYKFATDGSYVYALYQQVQSLKSNIDEMNDFLANLDMEIYSIEDTNHIRDLIQDHDAFIDAVKRALSLLRTFNPDIKRVDDKLAILNQIKQSADKELYHCVYLLGQFLVRFNLPEYMYAVSDPRFYQERTHEGDDSLIGYINQFTQPWPPEVKEWRNMLYDVVGTMMMLYNVEKSYTPAEADDFLQVVYTVQSYTDNLKTAVYRFWHDYNFEKDKHVESHIAYAEEKIDELKIKIEEYIDLQRELVEIVDLLRSLLVQLSETNISEVEEGFMEHIDEQLDLLMEDLGYMTGKNHRQEALDRFHDIMKTIEDWIIYATHEHETYEKMNELTADPNPYMTEVDNYAKYLNAIAEYLETLDREFIPDKDMPNYADVYYATEVELLAGGFNHKVDDLIYIPNLGVYKVTGVDDYVGKCTAIIDTDYRKTTFFDPLWQSNPFDSITNGTGLGITVLATKSESIPIINDTLPKDIITRVSDLFGMIYGDSNPINPFANYRLQDNLASIHDIHEEWNHTLVFYRTHMSVSGKSACNKLIELIEELETNLQELIDTRDKVDLYGFIKQAEAFINKEYKIFYEVHMVTPAYVYFDGRLRSAQKQLLYFYGDGDLWNDKQEMKAKMDAVLYEVKLFNNQATSWLSDSTVGKEELKQDYLALVETADSIYEAANKCNQHRQDIDESINNINAFIATLPPDDLQVDHWYELKQATIGEPGRGYRIGDIIQIKPELPKDLNGNPIETNKEMILNDKILFWVTQVDDVGKVLSLRPLLNYALPYQLWGTRETETLSGNGKGLVINAYAVEVNMFDSTLFYDSSSDLLKPDQFDRNDLMQFKFENIHDLNVSYEVYLDGKQQMNFIKRHLPTDYSGDPSNVDVIYLNANDVFNLTNSAIKIKGEHYFVYKINELNITDAGKGYTKGQNIYVDSGEATLKLTVGDLKPTPFKEIDSIQLDANQFRFNGLDPSSEEASVVDDSLNNIDDEFHVGHYDMIPKAGISKPATFTTEDKFISTRYDKLELDDRNETYMSPDIKMPKGKNVATNGDPDDHFYLGHREDYSDMSHKFRGMLDTISPTDPFIPDKDKVPTDKPLRGEYLLIDQLRIHKTKNPYAFEQPTAPKGTLIPINMIGNYRLRYRLDKKAELSTITDDPDLPEIHKKSYTQAVNAAMQQPNLIVETKADLPQHIDEWPSAAIGKRVVVLKDETHNNHRMTYRLRTYLTQGYLVYDNPEISDYEWLSFNEDWLKINAYPDYPTQSALYTKGNWYEAEYFRDMEEKITDKVWPIDVNPFPYNGSYIHNLTVDDLSVYNLTTHHWEDLHDETKWQLTVSDDYKFSLTYVDPAPEFSYNMLLFLNKVPETQKRNANLKQQAKFSVKATIIQEVYTKTKEYLINTGRKLRIRKQFPYQQTQSYSLRAFDANMNFQLANYMHFRNEIHAEDIVVYNKSADRFEDPLDSRMFELMILDNHNINEGLEIQTKIVQTMVAESGTGFVDGEAWAYNSQFGVHIFGRITADFYGVGGLLEFTPVHCPNPPTDDVTLEFKVYQTFMRHPNQAATILVEFQTTQVRVRDNGYLRNVINPLAPIKKAFRVKRLYAADTDLDYEISINKTPQVWKFVEPEWSVFPIFHIDTRIPRDRLYIVTNSGRIPLVNPSTGKPSFNVMYNDDGMDVQFLNIYKKYEQLEIHSTSYPMRSVYTQRRLPTSGYIDLKGQINKPLNKKYFEFWVNGRLLSDEVTIITPTKLFLHGLNSLRNFEIIEINRDSNEYFADNFLEVYQEPYDRPYPRWNFNTYLDDALLGNLEGDNYRPEEQELLLEPVWKQVDPTNPEYKDYPPNQDNEDDVLLRVDDYAEVLDMDAPTYQFMVMDQPTIEGVSISTQTLTFSQFGFVPITDEEITDMLDEEWKQEIEDGLIKKHSIISETQFYGFAVRLFDEYGALVSELNESAYNVTSDQILRINTVDKTSRIIRSNVTYDLN